MNSTAIRQIASVFREEDRAFDRIQQRQIAVAASGEEMLAESTVFNEEAVVLRKRSLTATLHRVRAMG
jgi:hypothetical protein